MREVAWRWRRIRARGSLSASMRWGDNLRLLVSARLWRGCQRWPNAGHGRIGGNVPPASHRYRQMLAIVETASVSSFFFKGRYCVLEPSVHNRNQPTIVNKQAMILRDNDIKSSRGQLSQRESRAHVSTIIIVFSDVRTVRSVV